MKPSWRSCKLNAFIRAAMTIQPPLINRDLSILAFNERVLDWAAREEVPLLERMRYLSIVCLLLHI